MPEERRYAEHHELDDLEGVRKLLRPLPGTRTPNHAQNTHSSGGMMRSRVACS